jgi:hypothetical protein
VTIDSPPSNPKRAFWQISEAGVPTGCLVQRLNAEIRERLNTETPEASLDRLDQSESITRNPVRDSATTIFRAFRNSANALANLPNHSQIEASLH